MKLELKHLTPYLLFDLKVKDLYENSIRIILGINRNHTEPIKVALVGKYLGVSRTLEEIKPILRPLDDLDKEIEFNGKKFIPYDELKTIVSNEQWLKICETIDLDGGEYSKVVDMPYWWVNMLHQWHFDTKGLIDENLAIDINTLKDV